MQRLESCTRHAYDFEVFKNLKKKMESVESEYNVAVLFPPSQSRKRLHWGGRSWVRVLAVPSKMHSSGTSYY